MGAFAEDDDDEVRLATTTTKTDGGKMFRGVFNTDTLRRRGGDRDDKAPADDEGDEKTEQAKARVVTSSAEPDRRPDVFDTHVGPFLERYVLWCQKKGVILGWIPGMVGAGMGWLTGRGIVKVLDHFGLVEKIRSNLDAL